MEKSVLNICKLGILCLLVCTSMQLSYAQSFIKDYSPLQSSGTLPEVFLKSAREQVEADLKSIPSDKDKVVRQQFITANNYFINDLLLSGQVLINDPLTTYVNKVAAEILEQNPSIASHPIQLFVTKSPEVNAYAFDKGFIFINIGLIAQLENEAQLAYILAHELIHINKKHSVTEYIQHKHYENDNTYDRSENEDRILAKYRFSKEQEREADVDGLGLIKKTNYSIKAIMGAFDVLQYSYLPFELLEFKKSFLEDDYLKLPDTLNLKKVSAIKSNDEYDDSKSTHPNIRKRRMSIEDDVKGISETGRKKYLVSEESFKAIRETARFELCRIYILKRDYVNAIYAAYILLQKYPDNLYLKKVVSKGLYNIAMSKANKESNTVIKINNSSSYSVDDYTTIEGASQRLYYLLDNLTNKEINVVALSYVYKASRQFPKDKTLSSLTDSLFSSLVNNNKMYMGDFSKLSRKERVLADTTKPVVEEEVEESKYATIKKLQASTEPEDDSFIKYAFVGLLKDNEFVSRYRKIAKGLEHVPVPEEYVYTKRTNKKSASKQDELLGIEKIILVDPYYKRVKLDGNGATVNYAESEEQQLKLLEIQKKCADVLKMSYVTISAKNLTPTDIEKYNESSLINEWIAERFRHGNNDEMMECSESMKELIEKKGTKYIALSGIYNSNRKNNSYFFMLLDLETGKVMRSEMRNNKQKDSNDLLHSYVYNSLLHVGKRPKK